MKPGLTTLAAMRAFRLRRLFGILIALITVFDGYDTFNLAYMVHYGARPWPRMRVILPAAFIDRIARTGDGQADDNSEA